MADLETIFADIFYKIWYIIISSTNKDKRINSPMREEKYESNSQK